MGNLSFIIAFDGILNYILLDNTCTWRSQKVHS